MSNVLGTLFGNIANAIREKTGETGTMKPAEFPDKIAAIETGGGSMEGVHTVTFMSEDGSSVLYERYVADGDDCANVVDRGLLATPTKASTAQYNYTYSGWSLTSGGAADANALKSVTADRTVYAAFASAVRYYTITYYDGDTVLKTESLPYGSMPSYTPEKDGYSFNGWEPALVTVTGDSSYSAQWIELVGLKSLTWDEIAEISASGTAAQTLQIGDSKTFTLTYSDGTTEDAEALLIGFGHDDLANGGGKAGLTFQTTPIGTGRRYNDSDKTWNGVTEENAGGWHISDIRTYMGSTLVSALPLDMANVIKEVTKTSDRGHADPTLTTTTDKLWILSSDEIGVETTQISLNTIKLEQGDRVSGQGSQYEYYSGKETIDEALSKFTNTWLRDTITKYKFYVCAVSTSARIEGKNVKMSDIRLSVGFCI